MLIIEIPICTDTTVRVPFSYACLREIRPTLSKDLPMMQIISILILQLRSPTPTTISALFSTLLQLCSPQADVVCSLHTLIVPKHNLKGNDFKCGLVVMRLDATKKMISNPHRVGDRFSTCLHMQNISLDQVMTCICMQIYYLFHPHPDMQAVQHKEVRGKSAIITQVPS